MTKKYLSTFLSLLIALIGMFFIVLFSGELDINFLDLMSGRLNSTESTIFWELRFPKAITAVLAGSALAVSGLVMQTYFQNPLAGPFVLGIHSGSSLGVAFWVMGATFIGSKVSELFLSIGSAFAAILGSLIVLFLLLMISRRVSDKISLLVFGLIFSYLTNGFINILISVSQAERIKTFLMWSLGSFSRISGGQLELFSLLTFIGLAASFTLIKPLNLLLLGDQYAKSSGLKLERIRVLIIILIALLSGPVTAFCGPIAFLGIMTPHIAKSILATHDHRYLLPSCLLLGSFLALFAEWISSLGGVFLLPINAILGLLGAPLIFLFLLNNKKREGWS